MTDARAIAAGLSEAQRAAMLQIDHWLCPGGAEPIAVIDCRHSLPPLLVNMFTLRWDRLTPLGLEVLAELRGGKG